jgi:hypothetical protein
VITAIDSRKVEQTLDVELALLGARASQEIELEVLRDTQPVSLQLATARCRVHHAQAGRGRSAGRRLGLKTFGDGPGEFGRLNTRYRGGLTVLDVRPGSPAEKEEFAAATCSWACTSGKRFPRNIAYILERDDLAKLDAVVFYIVRGSGTLYGHMRLAADDAVTSQPVVRRSVVSGGLGGHFWRQDHEAFDAEIDTEEAAFAGFRADAAGDEELIHIGPAERHVARGDVAAVVLTNQLAGRIEHLNLLHTVMGDVQVAGGVGRMPSG